MPHYISKPSNFDDLRTNLEILVTEAIYAGLENYDLEEDWPGGLRKVIDDLYEINSSGPKGRFAPESINLHHFIKSLVGDVFKAIEEIGERELEQARERFANPYPGRLYPEADHN